MGLRKSIYSSLSLAIVLFLALNSAAIAKPPSNEIIRLLPKELGGFRLVGGVRPSESLGREGLIGPDAAGQRLEADRHYSVAEAEYVSSENSRLLVEVVRFLRDSDAYSLLTIAAKSARDPAQGDLGKITNEVGTASVVLPGGSIAFFKGTTFVRITAKEPATQDPNNVVTLARLISDGVEKGEADIPILVKHLPGWEEAQGRVVYLAGFGSLRSVLPDQPILDSVSSEGDADAVAANYGPTQFIIVEYNTPQLAGDNDRSILAKIEELRTQGKLPSAYRRVGNYSVFVFNASDEKAARELIDQVEYEQVVQWLGDNPYMLEKAQREYYQTTAGVLVAVVKASGLSLLLCLTAGGFIGALLFSRRRAQQRQAEAFSDAGGMLRLNIDGITPRTDSAKLVGPGNRV
jgi:hypothetical protein